MKWAKAPPNIHAVPRKVEETIEVAARVDITSFDSVIILLGSLSLPRADNKVGIYANENFAMDGDDCHESESLSYYTRCN